MKLLTPEEVLQVIKDGKKLEWTYEDATEWYEFKPNEFTVENLLHKYYSFRLAQEMMTIGDVSFPKPETKAPKSNTNYFFPSFIKPSLVDFYEWTSDDVDYKLLKEGLIHLSKENAFAHAKALIKLSGGTYE